LQKDGVQVKYKKIHLKLNRTRNVDLFISVCSSLVVEAAVS